MKSQKWILLAEDNAKDADLAIRALSHVQSDCQVILACDGAEALDRLRHRGAFQSCDDGRPAVVLLDLKMPKMDGLEVLRQIKIDAALKTIPVVMFTSSCEKTDLLKSYELGANAYVVKPLPFPEFVSALKDLDRFWLHVNEPPPGDDAQYNAARPQLAGVA